MRKRHTKLQIDVSREHKFSIVPGLSYNRLLIDQTPAADNKNILLSVNSKHDFESGDYYYNIYQWHKATKIFIAFSSPNNEYSD